MPELNKDQFGKHLWSHATNKNEHADWRIHTTAPGSDKTDCGKPLHTVIGERSGNTLDVATYGSPPCPKCRKARGD